MRLMFKQSNETKRSDGLCIVSVRDYSIVFLKSVPKLLCSWMQRTLAVVILLIHSKVAFVGLCAGLISFHGYHTRKCRLNASWLLVNSIKITLSQIVFKLPSGPLTKQPLMDTC